MRVIQQTLCSRRKPQALCRRAVSAKGDCAAADARRRVIAASATAFPTPDCRDAHAAPAGAPGIVLI